MAIYFLKRLSVTLLIWISVVCAESMVATRSSKGVLKLRAVTGSGYSLFSRRRTSSTFSLSFMLSGITHSRQKIKPVYPSVDRKTPYCYFIRIFPLGKGGREGIRMTKDAKIRKTIASGESETVEFKSSFEKEVIETLAAFANTKG